MPTVISLILQKISYLIMELSCTSQIWRREGLTGCLLRHGVTFIEAAQLSRAGRSGQGGCEVPALEGGGLAAAAVQAGGGADAPVAPPRQRGASLRLHPYAYVELKYLRNWKRVFGTSSREDRLFMPLCNAGSCLFCSIRASPSRAVKGHYT